VDNEVEHLASAFAIAVGVTSYGGPVAHLGYFRPKIVMSIALAPPHLLRVFDVL
jgi:hypothetical protein